MCRCLFIMHQWSPSLARFEVLTLPGSNYKFVPGAVVILCLLHIVYSEVHVADKCILIEEDYIVEMSNSRKLIDHLPFSILTINSTPISAICTTESSQKDLNNPKHHHQRRNNCTWVLQSDNRNWTVGGYVDWWHCHDWNVTVCITTCMRNSSSLSRDQVWV